MAKIMTIAPEGYYIVGGVLAITISGTLLLGGHSWPLWIIFILIAQFFREPVRNIVANVDDIVSPADGRVVFIGRATSPANGKESLKISVFMNVFNVHANRSPVAGAVMRSQRFPGSFFNASLDKASEENERHLIEIDGKHGKIACMQIAGLLARRVLCHTNVGDTLSIGQRYGFIRFGSRADVYLPLNISPTVALGDSVVAGITRIAAPTT